MRPKSLNWFLLVSLFLGSVPGLFSQQPDTSSTIHSTTRLVEVDVIVTDKTQPVSDLKASDFTVFEDGKPQKLSVFSFESVADVAAKSTSPPPSLRPGIFTNRPEYHAPAGPLVILLMDGLNTPINQGIYVRKQILKYLTDLKTPKSGTAVLVLANDLIVLQDFTTDPQLLIAAAQKYKQGRTAADVETPAIDIPVTTGPGGGGNTGPVSVPSGVTGDFADTNLPSSQDGSFAGLADLQNRFEKMTEAQEQGIRIRATLDALRTIARAVSGYPGRKSLLWFSGSFPLNLAFN
jgi:VWFA-related protein